MRPLALAALLSLSPCAALAAPEVVVSINPLHALVARVMEGAGEPTLLVKGAASPHGYQLRPSDAQALQDADLVVWVGPSLESFVDTAMDELAGGAESLPLMDLPGTTVLAAREGGTWEAHDHDHDHEHGEEGHHEDDEHEHEEHADEEHEHEEHADEEHEHEEHADDEHEHEEHADEEHADEEHEHEEHGDERDPHLWLDPDNAILLTEAVAERLAELDPDNAALYRANAEAAVQEIAALDARLREQLAPLAGRPFVVFHDAYQYFEAQYGLNAVGSVTVSPDQAPGAERLRELRERIGELDALCAFAEPQFQPDLLQSVVEGTGAKIGVLDPIGAEIAPGPGAYEALLEQLGDQLALCLADQS